MIKIDLAVVLYAPDDDTADRVLRSLYVAATKEAVFLHHTELTRDLVPEDPLRSQL